MVLGSGVLGGTGELNKRHSCSRGHAVSSLYTKSNVDVKTMEHGRDIVRSVSASFEGSKMRFADSHEPRRLCMFMQSPLTTAEAVSDDRDFVQRALVLFDQSLNDLFWGFDVV